MGSDILEMKGALRRGNEVPGWNPWNLTIVGGPDADADVPYSDSYAGFFCPRASEDVDEEFVESIRKPNRVYETIHVVRFGKGEDAQLFVAAHRRCVKGARKVWREQEAAGVPEKERVLVRVQIHANLTPEQIYDLNIDENGQKKDLSPLQKAQHLAHAATVMKWDQRTIAKRFKMAQSAVCNALAMLKCAPEIQAMFCAPQDSPEYLAPQHAPVLAALPPHEQVSTVAAMREAGVKTTGDNVKQAVKQVKQAKQEEKKAPKAAEKTSAPKQVKINPTAVTHSRSRGLVEKVLAKVAAGNLPDLLATAGGELTQRDHAMIAMTLHWVLGNPGANPDFQIWAEECLSSKKENEAQSTEF